MSFSRIDAALPFFPAEAAGILPHAALLEELDVYGLKVTGLPAAGKYEVGIVGGGETPQELTAEQLAAGTNLAGRRTN